MGRFQPLVDAVEDNNVWVICYGSPGRRRRRALGAVPQFIDQRDLERIILRNGQAGDSTRTIEYLVKGFGDITVVYASLKGGTTRKTIPLK